MALALHFDNLWKSYAAGVAGCSARVWALRGCALDVEIGERVGIVGAPGSGKTTLVECLSGRRRPDAGRIAALHPVRFVDGDDALAMYEVTGTSIMTSRDVAGIRARVDRVVVLRDGRLSPLTRGVVRRVAERLR